METTFNEMDKAFKGIAREINEQTKVACYYTAFSKDGKFFFTFSPDSNWREMFTAEADEMGVIYMLGSAYKNATTMKDDILSELITINNDIIAAEVAAMV